ncbi:MORN repeat-containing protein 3-like [Orussus abietinus]|uniref:MORN repeat-containing protein 3-like n=1 Tax=Orussus abietinus TaxID=222816 RepID=UPI0006259C64|nr:MORN repeat-containing protein 3-like [Orussus abietinus]
MPFLKALKTSITKTRIENCKRNGSRHATFSPSTPLKDCYWGDFKNDKKEGKGTQLTRNNWLYEGDWSNGRRNGFGVLSKVSKIGEIWKFYSGDWVVGKKQGFGRYWYPDGSFYEGNFLQNKRHGFGRQWNRDGGFYQGTWKDDLNHGNGIFIQANGNRYEGEFLGGKKDGRGIFYHLDSGQMQEGCWKNDICVISTVEDIPWRQSANYPTPYPIPEVCL